MDPQILYSLLQRPQKGIPNFGETPKCLLDNSWASGVGSVARGFGFRLLGDVE